MVLEHQLPILRNCGAYVELGADAPKVDSDEDPFVAHSQRKNQRCLPN